VGAGAGCVTTTGLRGSLTSFRITSPGSFTMGRGEDLRGVSGGETDCCVRSLGCWTSIVGWVPSMMGGGLFCDPV
jgi:hypothetical protein